MCKPSNEEKRVLAAETVFRTNRPRPDLENFQSEIKFETPVNFAEIKILPPSVYMSTAKGGLILGATEPSKFSIHFLCNNVYRPQTTSFVSLGSMDYEEDSNTMMTCKHNIWSDRLVVCGQFSTVTVVVYGSPMDSDAKNVHKRDPLCNIPLNTGEGIEEIIPLAVHYHELHPAVMISRRIRRSDSNLSDGSDSFDSDMSDSSTASDRSHSSTISDRSKVTVSDESDAYLSDESNSDSMSDEPGADSMSDESGSDTGSEESDGSESSKRELSPEVNSNN